LAAAAFRHGSICFQPRWSRWVLVFGVLDHGQYSWMQVPSGYVMENGAFVPNDWTKIIFNSVVWSRFPHMFAGLLPDRCGSALPRPARGYILRKAYHAESRIMLRMGLGLAAVLMPIQLFFGHLNGIYVNNYQAFQDGCDRGTLERRETRFRGTVGLAGCGASAQPVRDHAAARPSAA